MIDLFLEHGGDEIGDRSLFGKDTFFEKSVRVPMLFTGDMVVKNEIHTPASIMDLGPTLCGISESEQLFKTDGQDLSAVLRGEVESDASRIVFSELMDNDFGKKPYNYARMAVKGDFKYITYDGYENLDMLFNVSEDPGELHNLILEFPDQAEELRAALNTLPDVAYLLERQRQHDKVEAWMCAVEEATGIEENERWQGNPATARGELKIYENYL